MIEPDALYTVNEAAEHLRCKKTNVYALLERGALARTSVGANGGGFRVRGAAILAFLDARSSGGPRQKFDLKHVKAARA